MEFSQVVGERVRAVRHSRGWSLGRLAETARVGKGSLSEIENGSRNPTLATLYALAGALEVPLGSLLAGRPGTRIASPGVEALLLDISESLDQVVEVYRLLLQTGARHDSTPHGPGVTEHLLITRGRAQVGRIGEQLEIGVGESASWVSDTEHGYAAVGEEPVESILVIRSPKPASGTLVL